ncbi:hypothetical protein Pan97_12870 [Bremerella volcania]|uniref:Uncharacterized protein n=1 Tax=Bremerella volcania TaxID=2527984 RepID=A0A518C4X3_9BACT|nr:hypothetical protein [Bremerella volcania]QDU74280.1 hypothetical protein Pan97_12870 [Bremerella volcania]
MPPSTKQTRRVFESPYLRLVQAASQVVVDDDYHDLIDRGDVASLRRIVSHNREALAFARMHLGPTCKIELVYEADFFAKNCPNMQHLRGLSRAFTTEGHLAGLENRWADAASIGLDLLELAGATGRGGLLCDHMVGWAISAAGIDLLRRWRAKYDEATLSHLLVRIPQIEAGRDDWNAVLERDRKWEEIVEYPDEPVDRSDIELTEEDKQEMSEEEIAAYYEVVDLTLNIPDEERTDTSRNLENRAIAGLRLMTLDTAIRMFRAMTGSYPRQLAELIPGVLAELPSDPFTERDFIYRPQWKGIFHRAIECFLLYSPGPSQTDHGGTFGPYPLVAAGEADLCLDEADYWSED